MPTTRDIVLPEGSGMAAVVSPPGAPEFTIRALTLAPARVWLEALALSGLATAAAFVLASVPLVLTLVAASLIAIGLAAVYRRTQPASLLLGLIPVTLLANSGLVPAATYFVPTATLGLSLVLWTFLSTVRQRRLPPLPPRLFVGFAVLYVAAVGVATVFSIRTSTSISYVAAQSIVVLVTLWLGPWLISRSNLAASMLAAIAAAGLIATLAGLVLSVTGPVLWFGEWLGVYPAHELTVSGRPIGIIVLRNSGPFLAPGGEALVLAPAILAALALRTRLTGRTRILASLAVVILVAGIIPTFTRVGWAAVIAGSAFLTLAPIRSRRIDVAAATVCAVMTIAFVGLWTNLLGADYRPDLTVARNGAAAAAVGGANGDAVPEIPTPATSDGAKVEGDAPRFVARGGSELSGRLELWSASVRAIAASPWVGYGPGTNAIAIEPYLQGEARRLVGLTSHNTWLRTWVELGVVGLVAFLGVALTALVLGIRRIASGGRATWLQLGMLSIFLALTVSQAFETFLLGGVSLPSFTWALAAGLLVIVPDAESSAVDREVDA